MKSLDQALKKSTQTLVRETNKIKTKAVKERENQLRADARRNKRDARNASIGPYEDEGEEELNGVQTWNIFNTRSDLGEAAFDQFCVECVLKDELDGGNFAPLGQAAADRCVLD